MTRQSRRLTRILCGAAIFAATILPVGAELELRPLDAHGQFRDAAADPQRGRFFVAVYDQDAVWSIDTATGRIATTIRTGDGPAALATDGQLLAVANRLDGTVTLIHLADLSIAGTVKAGDGPSAITALGDGRFITANTFSDTLSAIDTRGTLSATTVEVCPAVPVDIAATDRHIIAIGRNSATAQIYDRASLAPLRTITFPERVLHAVSVDGGNAVVASPNTLYLADLEGATILRSQKAPVNGITASNGVLGVLSERAYMLFSSELALLETQALDRAYPMIVASGSVVALLDPRNQQALVHGLDSLQTGAAPPVTEIADLPAADGDTMVVVEAEPVGETPATAPEEPVVTEAESPAEPTPALETVPDTENKPDPEPEMDLPAESEPLTDADTVAPTTSTPDSQPTVETIADPTRKSRLEVAKSSDATPGASIRRNPIQTRGVRAPSLGRPSASPLQQLSRTTITDALVQPTEFGSTEGGFQAPDLTQNLENITFDNASKEAGSDTMNFTGFRAEFGDLTLTTKNLTHQRDPVQIHATGDVLITQQTSSITADEIQFRLEDPGTTPEAPQVLEGEDGEGTALDQGRLTLRNAHIIEPTREMTADYLDYDFRTGQGELENAKGQAGIYYFAADKLHLHGPQSLSGENVWVTTCDRPHPHYKIRLSDLELVDGQPVAGSNARLQLGRSDTPLYLPRWRRGGVGGSPWNMDFDSGRQANIGYYVNAGQAYEISPDVAFGPRLFVTEKEGVGLGADLSYDFMENPASRLYRTRGEAHGLYTSEDRGYIHWYHRYEYSDDLVLRAQVEHWGDEDFYQDFYYDAFRNRSRPRSFANVTYRQPAYIATGSVRPQSHGWFAETEQLPEATFHLLERPLTENLYFSFDTANGYYNREPRGVGGARSANTARLTYNWDPHPAVAITPFWEVDGSFYTRDRGQSDSTGTLSTNLGVTAQTRLHRTYGGRWGFSGFKHLIVPSITYSYRPDTNVDPLTIPQYDPLDSVFGRSRIETKISNIIYGRDAETGEVWQVGRITLYQGNDLRNETRTTEDYEVEVDIRPRPFWGVQVVGERQVTSDEDASLNRYSIARNAPGVYNAINNFLGRGSTRDFSGDFGDYNRILSQVYYDGEPRGDRLSGRIGFAYTETRGEVFNREALYGLGYKISDKWGFGFEHIYDFEDGDLRTQTYELRRSLHCWETAIRFRDRESGFDINFEFNIKAFPGSRIKI